MAVVAFDLDDTLMAEMDFVRSAWSNIARYVAERYGEDYGFCLEAIMMGENPYDSLYDYLLSRRHKDVISAREMVEMYRNHTPVSLPPAPGAVELLRQLKDAGHTIAIVTDGRVNTQTAKINALGLREFVAPEDIFISQATGYDKTSPHNFGQVMLAHPGCGRFYYVGDNTSKDFENPNKLGWTTIAVRDVMNHNIHPQNFDVDEPKRPHHIVDSLDRVYEIIDTGA